MNSDAARYRDLALVVLVPLFFSTNVVIGRAVAADVGPWTLAFLRWTGAFLILLPFAAAGLRAHRTRLMAQGAAIVALAFLGMWICGGLVYMALDSTTATNATLIYTSANVMILVLEWLFRGRRIGLRELVGTGLAFAGVAVVALGAEGASGLRVNPGDLLIALAALSWAIYSVVLKRPGLAALPGLPLFAAIVLTGSVLLLPAMLWENWRAPALPVSPQAWMAVAGVALIPSVGAFSGYQYGIRRFGPGTMAMVSYLTTPYGVLLAVLFLGESLGRHHLVGLALILPGIILATARRSSAPAQQGRERMNEPAHLDLEAEYDNRARVPEHPQIIAGWERDAAAYRAARSGRCELGIAYGAHARQTIDLFRPDQDDPARPLIVFIHGGYWRSLEPGLFSHMAAGANARGFSVALPGYRLCPEVALPDVIEDVRAACLFLWRRFGRRMVACGHSAGGHLAAAMAATDWNRLAPDAPADLLRRGLGISGIYDLAPLLATSVNQSLHLDAATARAASPAFWPVPAGVHFEAWFGAAEASEYFRQSRLLAARWAAGGARTRAEAIPGANHFTAPDPLADPDSAMTQTLLRLCETNGQARAAGRP